MRKISVYLTIFYFWAFVPIISSCNTSSLEVDEGFWYGETIDFKICNNTISEIRIKGVHCSGTTVVGGSTVNCYSNLSKVIMEKFPLSDKTFKYQGDNFELTIVFESSKTATGTIVFVDVNCCGTEEKINAELYSTKNICNGTQQHDIYEPQDFFDISDVKEDSGVDVQTDLKNDSSGENNLSEKQKLALEKVNQTRTFCGGEPVSMNELINKAAMAHAQYVVKNFDKYKESGLSVHEENPEWEGFTGKTFVDRMKHFGYSPMGGWEVIAFANNPEIAVASWLETLYHRIPLVHPNSFEIGYGAASSGVIKIDVMDISSTNKGSNISPVFYPCDGMEGVSPSWAGNETPKPPLPSGASYPTGPVITISFPFSVEASCSEFKIFDKNNQELKTTMLTPSNDSHLLSTYAIIPLSPLSGGKVYKVAAKCKVSGKDYSYEWSFKTKK